MPFVHVYWDETVLSGQALSVLIDDLVAATADALHISDPAHIVTPAMFDVRVETQGPLDRFRAPVFVTLLARYAPAREDGRSDIVARAADALGQHLDSTQYVVELVLTNHTSSFDYTALEGQ